MQDEKVIVRVSTYKLNAGPHGQDFWTADTWHVMYAGKS